jgi:hypothetical protein
MDQNGPGADPLARFPRRPHRLIVLVILILALGIGLLAWRKSQHRWPPATFSKTASDMTETDIGQRKYHPGHHLPTANRPGSPAGSGFHPSEPSRSAPSLSAMDRGCVKTRAARLASK